MDRLDSPLYSHTRTCRPEYYTVHLPVKGDLTDFIVMSSYITSVDHFQVNFCSLVNP